MDVAVDQFHRAAGPEPVKRALVLVGSDRVQRRCPALHQRPATKVRFNLQIVRGLESR